MPGLVVSPAEFPDPVQVPPREVDPAKPTTIADVLRPHMISFSTLKKRYGFLEFLHTLLGSAPNALCLTELFPPAFATENVIVPAMLSLPQSMFGLGTNLQHSALCMYAASRMSGCQYCSLHCVTMGLRRGMPEDKVEFKDLTPVETACVNLGTALGALPPRMTRAVYDDMVEMHGGSAAAAETIFRGALMMGWLGRVVDMLGLDMEGPLVDEVGPLLRPLGWSTARHAVSEPSDSIQVPAGGAGNPRRGDNLTSRFEILKIIPASLSYDRRTTEGYPSEPSAIATFLMSSLGNSFPVVSRLTSGPARRAVAFALHANSVSDACALPLGLKAGAGAALAYNAKDLTLVSSMRDLSTHAVSSKTDLAADNKFNAILDIAQNPEDGTAAIAAAGGACDEAWVKRVTARLEGSGMSARDAAAATLALSATTSPVLTGPAVSQMAQARLQPAEIVETVSWMGAVGMLVRLNAYYGVVPELE